MQPQARTNFSCLFAIRRLETKPTVRDATSTCTHMVTRLWWTSITPTTRTAHTTRIGIARYHQPRTGSRFRFVPARKRFRIARRTDKGRERDSVNVELLYFEGCPNWRTAEERLTALQPELGFNLTRQLVSTPEDAERLGFRGSKI